MYVACVCHMLASDWHVSCM